MQEAVARRTQRWGGKLFLMPPLYISGGDPHHGGCLDYCVYCPWQNENVPARQIRRLTTDEVVEQICYLIGIGYGDIELVAATDPELLKAEKAAKFVRVARAAGAQDIDINFFPLWLTEDYRQLTAAGCSFAIVWQEIYLPDVYRQMHPRGLKANMQYRLNAHNRALQVVSRQLVWPFLAVWGIGDTRHWPPSLTRSISVGSTTLT